MLAFTNPGSQQHFGCERGGKRLCLSLASKPKKKFFETKTVWKCFAQHCANGHQELFFSVG